MIKWIIEDDEFAMIRKALKGLSTKQLILLEEIIKREKSNRHKRLFTEWLDELNEHVQEHDQYRNKN